MTFAAPHVLWLLVLPAAWLARELTHRRRAAAEIHPRIARAEAGWRGLSLNPGRLGQGAARGPRLWLCAGLALAIAAMARPQWGRIDEPVFDQSREVLLALDLSRSMLSQDVKPSRLDRAKLLIQSLLDHLQGERVGLVIFSGTAFLQSPLSADYEILREFLPSLGPSFLPEGGTNYRAMLDAALDAFGTGSAADRYLVVLSDGEATDDHWRDRIPELKRRGIHVIGLGVGTAAGSLIPDGSGGLVKDDTGAAVLSKLESGTLRELADATGGAYRDAGSWVDVPALIQATVDAGRKGSFVEHQSVRYVERYQWALAPALFCLLASFWREFPVRTRSRDLRWPTRPVRKVGGGAATAAATGAARLALALLAVWGAAATVARAASPSAPAPTAAASPSAGLSRIVGRLADQERTTGLDWSELARETIDWGHHLESSQQQVPEGPVRDALAGVAAGAKLDAEAADWTSLRSELEQLLNRAKEQTPPKDQPKPPQQQNSSKQNSQNQKSSSSSSSPDSSQSNPSPGSPPKDQNGSSGGTPPPSGGSNPPPDRSGQSGQSNPPGQSGDQGAKPPTPGSSAFGDMKSPASPPPSSSAADAAPPSAGQGPMQKVGGVPEHRVTDPARSDPALAGSLDKLQQLSDRDSPAELFELMRRGEPAAPPATKGKTW